MKIKDILDKKGAAVRTIGPDQTVTEAVSQLCAHRIGALVVLGAGGKIEGIITERDVLHECGELIDRLSDPARSAASGTRRVRDIMTTSLIIGVPDDTVDYVMGVMTKNRVRHLPVVEDNKLIGIVSIGDLVNAVLRETTYENRVLMDYIHGAIATG
jgi:CBS domain-containing protein